MTDQADVKVFVSWSGDLAKAVAVALREWLPLLFDRVAPWASDTDIAAGQRSLAQIESELADTRFGLVVVTAQNQNAPWLNFEAGALSRTVGGNAEHRVVPLLVDLASPADLTGPLAQFQAKTAQHDGVRDVVRSLAEVAGIPEAVADMRFDAYWPRLEASIEAAKAAVSAGARQDPEPRAEGDVLNEILLHVRSLRSELDGSARHDPAPTATQKRERAFQGFVTDLAAAHGMDVYEIEGTLGDRSITLMPKGNYNSAAEEDFSRAFREQAPKNDRSARITVIPF